VERSIKVACLPIAGIENPYQYLMMEGLRKNPELEVFHGKSGKFFALLRTAISQRPDYIHVDWLHQYYLRKKHWMTWVQFPFFAVELLLLKMFCKVHLTWTLHNIQPHDRPYFGPYKWARQLFAKHCVWIRVFSENTIGRASEVLKCDADKFRGIPEGSYVGYYPNEITQKEAREKLSILESERVFLFLGLIKPYKGLEELIEAFQYLNPENARLLIAGKPIDQTYFQNIANLIHSEKIEIHPKFISNEELQVYFNAADVVVLPFKKIENSGSAILAMGFAKVIIAPNTGSVTKRLDQQKEFLFNQGELGKKLLEAATIPIDKLRAIGENNSRAVQQHKWECFAKAFYT
jgi:beta-1,4-mannosyltransferase